MNTIELGEVLGGELQAKWDSSGTSQLPAVFHKKNNAEILVTMELADWMRLYREYEVNMSEVLNHESKTR